MAKMFSQVPRTRAARAQARGTHFRHSIQHGLAGSRLLNKIMKTYALRLIKGQDLKREIFHFTKAKNIQAGCILSCVGHLTKATLRMADASIIKEFERDFEIISLEGTLCQNNVHLHISLSDKEGKCIGGHVKDNCLIGVTAEIVIVELDDIKFSREYDEDTGYKELKIN